MYDLRSKLLYIIAAMRDIMLGNGHIIEATAKGCTIMKYAGKSK